MATEDPIQSDGLPSYGDVATTDAANQMLQPTTLYAASRFIHSSDPQAAPLYELSHSVGFLSDTNRKVVLERLEHNVRNVGGIPTVATRKRSLFHLTHRTAAEMPAFAFQAESRTRRTASMGIERVSRFGRRSGFRVCRAFFSGTGPGRYEVGPVMFSAVPPTSRKQQDVAWEWSDGEGPCWRARCRPGG
ncbi:hypothetical protein V2G26_010072 [Clonostachys chloroleuca]